MPAKLLTAPERTGRTFGIALRVLGVIALIQMILILWAMLIRFDGRPRIAPSATSRVAALPASLPPPVAIPERVTPSVVSESPGESSGSVAAPPEVIVDPVSIPAPRRDSKQEIHPAHRVPDPEAKGLVDRGLQLREEGDINGALAELKKADARVPQHPKILAELATTYSQFGQTEKATGYWERVHLMGSAAAGAYWDLADMALKGHSLDDASNVNTELKISRHVARGLESGDGQKVILRIHTEALTDSRLDGQQMYLYVFFYDLAEFPGGSRYEETVAKMTQRLITSPYDWNNGEEEVIEVEYFLKKLTKDQEAALGKRQYFGYVVELYYRDVLQDVVASPRKLLRSGEQPTDGIPYQGSSLFPQ
ncbi:MAG: tetratricopeptide repeat protein [Verrucomicrobiota bacterium]